VTDAAVVLDLAAGRVYHFKHGWIPLDHIGRERLRAHGVNPDGYNVVHNGKLAANWRTKREAIAHADRLNAGKKAAAKVQPSQHAPGHHNVVKNGKLVATYQSEHGARRHADQLNADTKAAASVHHATPTGTGARIDTPRSKARTSSRTLATRMPADGRDKAAPRRREQPWRDVGSAASRDTTAPVAELRQMVMANRLDPNSPRIQALVADIRKNGVLQPIFVEHTNRGPLVGDGTHRLLAADIAGVKHVPVRVFANTPEGRRAANRAMVEVEAAKDLQTRADAAVRMKAPELRALAASGDKVAQAELARRAKQKATR
jgi:hypothetical protein